MTQDLLQETVNASCESAQASYQTLTERESRLKFSYELQGFIASEVGRGSALPDVVLRVADLLIVLCKTNNIL